MSNVSECVTGISPFDTSNPVCAMHAPAPSPPMVPTEPKSKYAVYVPLPSYRIS